METIKSRLLIPISSRNYVSVSLFRKYRYHENLGCTAFLQYDVPILTKVHCNPTIKAPLLWLRTKRWRAFPIVRTAPLHSGVWASCRRLIVLNIREGRDSFKCSSGGSSLVSMPLNVSL
jgi:hypothetical protein